MVQSLRICPPMQGMQVQSLVRELRSPHCVCVCVSVCVYVCVCVCLCVCSKLLSCAQFFVTPWTVAHHRLLSVEFSRQEYWDGLPFPTPGDLTDSGIESSSPMSFKLAGRFFTTAPPGKPQDPTCQGSTKLMSHN